jgi:hypothetical protein
MRHHRAAAALKLSFEARPENDGTRKSDEAADSVGDREASKVVEAGAEPGQKVARASAARNTSGPQAQRPMMGWKCHAKKSNKLLCVSRSFDLHRPKMKKKRLRE